MAKKSFTNNKFYCLNCGQESFPIMRRSSQQKERFHRKKLYCFHCKKEVNHIECKTQADVDEFTLNFSNGNYKTEAEDSMKYCQGVIL